MRRGWEPSKEDMRKRSAHGASTLTLGDFTRAVWLQGRPCHAGQVAWACQVRPGAKVGGGRQIQREGVLGILGVGVPDVGVGSEGLGDPGTEATMHGLGARARSSGPCALVDQCQGDGAGAGEGGAGN